MFSKFGLLSIDRSFETLIAMQKIDTEKLETQTEKYSKQSKKQSFEFTKRTEACKDSCNVSWPIHVRML